MGKTKKQKNTLMPVEQQNAVQEALIVELDSNPEYALVADPTGKLNLSESAKTFIQHYVNFKSIATAADLTGIDANVGRQYFADYNVQNEIRRINRALYQRQFTKKLISIDNIAGYLSSLLTDENVPIADQLKTTEKLRVIELLLRLNELKAGMNNPQTILNTDISVQIKNLSVNTIQQLLNQNNTIKAKNELISSIDDGALTMEDKSYLQSLPTNELLAMIEEINGGKNESQ